MKTRKMIAPKSPCEHKLVILGAAQDTVPSRGWGKTPDHVLIFKVSMQH